MKRHHKRSSLHRGHRARLKRKFIHSGGADLNDHEILELLLYYSIPRRNTNDVAHQLLNEFGNFENILNASAEEIAEIEGAGENSAILIKLVTALAKRHPFSEESSQRKFSSIDKATLCARQMFSACQREVMYAAFMDDSMNVLGMTCICVGTDNEVRPIIRSLIEKSVKAHATALIVFHNHPTFDASPSQNDIDFTTLLYRELKIVGIDLVEHLIIANDECETLARTMRNQGLLPKRTDLENFYKYMDKD